MNIYRNRKFNKLIKITCYSIAILLTFILASSAYSYMTTNNNVTFYIQELKSQNVLHRQAATLNLMEIGKDAQEAVPALIQALKDPDSGVRRNSALALGRSELASTEVMNALVSATLNDSYDGVRSNAIGSIGRLQEISPLNQSVIATLSEMLQDKNEQVRNTAVIVLGHLGSKARDAVPSLIKASLSGDDMMRERAIFALGKIGEASTQVFSALTEALKSDVKHVHLNAIRALGEIRPVNLAHIDILTKVLSEQDATSRKVAMTALSNLGIDAQTAISSISIALHDKDVSVSKTAAYALKKIKGV